MGKLSVSGRSDFIDWIVSELKRIPTVFTVERTSSESVVFTYETDNVDAIVDTIQAKWDEKFLG